MSTVDYLRESIAECDRELEALSADYNKNLTQIKRLLARNDEVAKRISELLGDRDEFLDWAHVLHAL